ncbi:HNH endonuclease [Streptomyces bingchenggensis BCW-1]|uniref:HNH endonuclease n=1 Tax=Streptomyces bingchenggensis (strain BCW-1) TaxID=749414 RepID=D7CEJ3_STRBB|nr:MULTISPECIES: HNH endonuclease [Streptomyces]ADI08889.1 HNH endonuclease [Streptomyces bingchenggensis BCW-1]
MRSPSWTRDELLLACALVVENGWRELRENDARTHSLSTLLRSLPLHGDAVHDVPSFRSTGSVSRKTTDLATNHPSYTGKPTRCGRLDKEVISDFIARPAEMVNAAKAIMEGISSGELTRIPEQPDEVAEDGATSPEGRLLARWTISRERDPRLRRRKIERVRRLGQPLQCEVCRFHFGRFYGRLGEGYIEVHHVLPLHISGPRETQLDDLALLCSNCHRMCHRGHLGESWRTPAALRAEMERTAK